MWSVAELFLVLVFKMCHQAAYCSLQPQPVTRRLCLIQCRSFIYFNKQEQIVTDNCGL